jgi:hypothetical protein
LSNFAANRHSCGQVLVSILFAEVRLLRGNNTTASWLRTSSTSLCGLASTSTLINTCTPSAKTDEGHAPINYNTIWTFPPVNLAVAAAVMLQLSKAASSSITSSGSGLSTTLIIIIITRPRDKFVVIR